MIHYWECKKCTAQWVSCCGGHMFETPEQKALEARKPYDLCERCFLALEASDDPLLRVLRLKQQLEQKNQHLRRIIDEMTAILGFGYPYMKNAAFRELASRI